MTDAIVIEIPAGPAYAISPNSRKHWRTKAKETKQLKETTILACLQLHEPYRFMLNSGPVDLHWTIYLGKLRRPMDRDNATSTMKPAMDGLVKAGVIEDDTSEIVRAITVDQVKWATHKGQPTIVVEVRRAA